MGRDALAADDLAGVDEELPAGDAGEAGEAVVPDLDELWLELPLDRGGARVGIVELEQPEVEWTEAEACHERPQRVWARDPITR